MRCKPGAVPIAPVLVEEDVRGVGMTEFHDRQTMERLHEHLARAEHELRDAQHFLDPASAEESEMDLVHAVAAARLAVTTALVGTGGPQERAQRPWWRRVFGG